ncbi:MAG: 3-methyl-2-oxobutanoate hydroxymethyltransferase [Pseudomonadota bacterium]|jgi:3-methyl-2-oxobutanoate hydroxymethyltransferase
MQQVPIKFTINDFLNYKHTQRKITMITVYDFHMAQIIAETAVDVLLVGDSLGMVVQGNNNTLSVTLDEMAYHAKAVRRGAPHKFIIVDMPYLSYHLDPITTIKNAGYLIQTTQADAVKLEINHPNLLAHIQALVSAQIPVIAHVGMTPQSVNLFGGFKTQGKTIDQAQHILDLAIASQEHGASAVVLECIPRQLAAEITAQLTISSIGIGAGEACDGQVLVLNDLLGFTPQPPHFAKQYLAGRDLICQAVNQFSSEVTSQEFPIFSLAKDKFYANNQFN